MKHALIVGGSGFIGQALVRTCLSRGYRVSVFDIRIGSTEHEHLRYYPVDVQGGKLPSLPLCDVIINLAGAPINHRFTKEYKKILWSSRIICTRSLRQWVETQSWQPQIYVGASAVGYYGNRGNETLSEQSRPGQGTLARICVDWEREHKAFEKLGIPVATLRQGHVLGAGGFLQEILPWFRRGFRVIIGNGVYYLPWIDLRDLCTLYMSLIEGKIPPGTYNAVATDIMPYTRFSRVLAGLTHARIPLPVPVWALRLRYGELADHMTASQRIQTGDAIATLLQHPDLSASLSDIVTKWP